MEVVISVSFVFKMLLLSMVFLFLSGFLAFMFLFPVNDKPTSKTQWTIYGIVEVILFAYMFGFFTFKLVA